MKDTTVVSDTELFPGDGLRQASSFLGKEIAGLIGRGGTALNSSSISSLEEKTS